MEGNLSQKIYIGKINYIFCFLFTCVVSPKVDVVAGHLQGGLADALQGLGALNPIVEKLDRHSNFTQRFHPLHMEIHLLLCRSPLPSNLFDDRIGSSSRNQISCWCMSLSNSEAETPH